MKQTNRYIFDMLDFDSNESENDVLWIAGRPISAAEDDSGVTIDIPFQAQNIVDGLAPILPNNDFPPKIYKLNVSLLGDSTIRFYINPLGSLPNDKSVMFEWDSSIINKKLHVRATNSGFDIIDENNMIRMVIRTKKYEYQKWNALQSSNEAQDRWEAYISPDGNTKIPFLAYDQFFPGAYDSLPLAIIERDGIPYKSIFALHAEPNERFAGTGERFSRADLSGQTIDLENMDAMGVNNRKAYKNIPFYISSKPYGLFIHTSSHIRLSIAHMSTRTVQSVVEDPIIDLFFIGGNSIEKIVKNYRCITGFPKKTPLWSYGIWMSRMTYYTAEETYEIADNLRKHKFPCDVIHLDTAWFKENWQCDWQFSKTKFPDPAAYIQNMRNRGFRTSLWQLPTISKNNALFEIAKENHYIAPKKTVTAADGSNFGGLDYAGTLDFSNPDTVLWYKDMLRKLLEFGVAAIKIDFGEEIDMEGEYKHLPAKILHNQYALLYQKAAYEISEEVKGQGLIWARSAWAGSQRYPVHWGGDSACTWDGMAGTIRGGLHLGLSGFGFWSHDIPGFHGVPGFTDSKPANDIYVRWTQLGAFSSHMRYHGGFPREPYEYPEIADIVRGWYQFRYSLIPYLMDEAEKITKNGLPIFRSMIFHHNDDLMCWIVDDQFYCGDNLLVAPILNSEGIRDVYLPAGSWTDIWTGEVINGPIIIKNCSHSLSKLPVFAVTNSRIRIYPEIIQCTDEMDLSKSEFIVFDYNYKGLGNSILKDIVSSLL